MFRVVILHKFMTRWKYITNEGNKVLLQDIRIHVGIHNSFKITHTSGTFVADPSPNVHFNRVFRTWLAALFVAVKTAVTLHQYTSFVRPNHVVERFSQVITSPLQSLRTVGLADELAIRRSASCPPQQMPPFQSRSSRHGDPVVGTHRSNEFLPCSFVLSLHSVFDRLQN